ncbi:MAG: 5-(carboxyamino)imidazole ribonucleotide mutase [Clostridia bacterium]|nr:5-(carboxyamino)imidazole ribonucleotide mutase [Clostridia bacterium]
MPKIAIVMGSASDLDVMKRAIDALDRFGVEREVRVLSAHRTPDAAREFVKTAQERGVRAFIAGAGKAAHLAGAIAAQTILPVIGVPLKSSALDGLDALLSTVQMPAGMPVATVAIDGAENAALLAVQILACTDAALAEKYEKYRQDMTKKVLEKDMEIGGAFNG